MAEELKSDTRVRFVYVISILHSTIVPSLAREIYSEYTKKTIAYVTRIYFPSLVKTAEIELWICIFKTMHSLVRTQSVNKRRYIVPYTIYLNHNHAYMYNINRSIILMLISSSMFNRLSINTLHSCDGIQYRLFLFTARVKSTFDKRLFLIGGRRKVRTSPEITIYINISTR